MQMSKPTATTLMASTRLLVVCILAASFAIVPFALAASSGSDYPMEIIRAHTAYNVADPATAFVGIGVHGDR